MQPCRAKGRRKHTPADGASAVHEHEPTLKPLKSFLSTVGPYTYRPHNTGTKSQQHSRASALLVAPRTSTRSIYGAATKNSSFAAPEPHDMPTTFQRALPCTHRGRNARHSNYILFVTAPTSCLPNLVHDCCTTTRLHIHVSTTSAISKSHQQRTPRDRKASRGIPSLLHLIPCSRCSCFVVSTLAAHR